MARPRVLTTECRVLREPRQRSGSRALRAIGHGRPTRGRRLPSGGEEQTERGEQDEGGNRPAKDLETHRATSFSGFNRFVERTLTATAG